MYLVEIYWSGRIIINIPEFDVKYALHMYYGMIICVPWNTKAYIINTQLSSMIILKGIKRFVHDVILCVW